MPKFQAIVLSLALGYASAQGCFPAYTPGASYSVGAAVSSSVSVITPIAWTVCTVSPTCTTGYVQTGGVTTTTTNNYVCFSPSWCSNIGYAPGTVYEYLAWTKEATTCSGTAAPPPAPVVAAWTGIGCPNAYVAAAQVEPGASVTVVKNGVSLVYTCNAWPTGAHCPQSGYEPGSGTAWEQAWKLEGSCTGTITPTSSPVSSLPNQGGCPVAYSKGATYVAGDLVSKSGMVFQCKTYPMSLFCSQEGYEPLTTAHGEAYKLAWTTLGPCSGTIAPATSSPVTAAAIAAGGGCPQSYVSGGSYSAGSQVSKVTSNTAVVKKYECKQWPESQYCNSATYTPGGQYGSMAWTDLGQCFGTLAPSPTLPCNYLKYTTTGSYTITPTQAWSASTNYAVGDEVRVNNKAFKCKVSGWCTQAAYTPNLGTTGIWTSAWDAVGDCKDNTYSPTAAPTFKPTAVPTAAPTSKPTSAPTCAVCPTIVAGTTTATACCPCTVGSTAGATSGTCS